MDIAPIKNKKDYRAALREIESLMSAKPNTPQGDRLDILVTLVEAYERKHYPMPLPDPVEAIRFYMEQKGLEPKDLTFQIGKPNRVYEILNRKRSLTLAMIRRLHRDLGIPAEILLGEPRNGGAAPSTSRAKGRYRSGRADAGERAEPVARQRVRARR